VFVKGNERGRECKNTNSNTIYFEIIILYNTGTKLLPPPQPSTLKGFFSTTTSNRREVKPKVSKRSRMLKAYYFAKKST
jgi:hypothetical protein